MAEGFSYIPNPHANDLDQILSDMSARARQQEMLDSQQKEASALATRQMQNQSDLLKYKALHDQFNSLTPEQQKAVWGRMPDMVKQWSFDPSTIPLDQLREAERGAAMSSARLKGLEADNNYNIQKTHTPSAAETSVIYTHGLTGSNPNNNVVTDAIDRSALTPGEYHTSVYAPTQEKMAKASNENAEAGFKTAQTKEVAPNAAATRTKDYAQAEEARASGRSKDALTASSAATANPNYSDAVVQGVLSDPQSFFSLPKNDKTVVMQTLRRAPSKLGAAEVERMNAAKIGRQMIDDADAIVKKWQARGTPITGPMLGRFNAAEGKWGDTFPLTNLKLPLDQRAEYGRDIAQLREWLTALPVQEAKALAGGRTAYQVIEAITSTAPGLTKGADMFEGSTQGLRTRFDQIDDYINKKQWGGKPPVYRTTTNPSVPGNVTALKPDGKGGFIYVGGK